MYISSRGNELWTFMASRTGQECKNDGIYRQIGDCHREGGAERCQLLYTIQLGQFPWETRQIRLFFDHRL